MTDNANQTRSTLNAVLSYAARGWLVFPVWGVEKDRCACQNTDCRSPGKHPLGALAPNGLKDATTDAVKIRNWFTEYPAANIGLVTGEKSGFFVLDCDASKGSEASLAELGKSNGKLPSTVESKTGGGGRHILFKYPDFRVPNSAEQIAPGLDIRGDGGYVVAPASLHKSGQVYEWNIKGHPDNVEIAEAPAWLLENIIKNSFRETDEKEYLPDINYPPFEINWLARIPTENWNDFFIKLATAARRSRLSEKTTLQKCLDLRNREQDLQEWPEFTNSEIERIVQSAYAHEYHVSLRDKTIAPFIKFTNGNSNMSGQELRVVSLKDLLAEPDESVDYLVDGLLPKGGLSLVAAKPKVGKSTLARQLALAVARGEAFLGRQTERGLVIYLALEERKADVKSHFRAMGGSEEEHLYIFAGMAPTDCLTQLRRIAESKKPSLIIADTLARLVRIKDLNDYSQATFGLEPLIALAREVGAHVMLLHHSKKGDGKGIDSVLGSTGLAGSVDTIIILNRTDEYRTISSIQRNGNDLPESVLHFDKNTKRTTLGESKEEEETIRMGKAIIEFLVGQETSVEEKVIDEQVDGNRSSRKKVLRQLVNEDRVIRSGGGRKGDPYLYQVSPSDDAGILVPATTVEPENQKSKIIVNPHNQNTYSGSGDILGL